MHNSMKFPTRETAPEILKLCLSSIFSKTTRPLREGKRKAKLCTKILTFS